MFNDLYDLALYNICFGDVLSTRFNMTILADLLSKDGGYKAAH
jgi:hypothetical protein